MSSRSRQPDPLKITGAVFCMQDEMSEMLLQISDGAFFAAERSTPARWSSTSRSSMSPTLWQIVVLGLVQGAAELLPVSSSAHVIVAEKLMGLDPSSPEMTFMLVMLHTGTMFAVIAYFWRAWRQSFFASRAVFVDAVKQIVVATFCTGVLGLGLKELIEKVFLGGGKAEIEHIFSSLPLIAAALAVGGGFILVAAIRASSDSGRNEIAPRQSAWIGAVQGVVLPFRGFSRSGGTISAAMLAGIGRRRAEEFSFALAVVLTPPVIARELLRLLKANAAATQPVSFGHLTGPGLVGMLCSFGAGLLALRWLSRWLENGRWSFFGYYCLAAAVVIGLLAGAGY